MPHSLYIIDGHAQIYRSYYAVMGLKSPSGEPTNATFGFVGMLLKLYQMRKPSHVVLAMDAGSSGRETLDTSYKAQRKPMPEDMPPQIERILQIVDTLGMPIYKAEGYEADDAMATLIRQVRSDPTCPECRVYMCTKDKDLDQLIDDHCVMYDIQTNEEINAAALMEKKGYSPSQARDVLALTGDTVDNIPGIPGVGPKTAAKWIQTYGSLDALLQNTDKITGKIGDALRNNLHLLENSRKLVELQFDVPVPPLDWSAASVHPEHFAKLAPIFQQLGFTKLLTMLEQVVTTYRNDAPFSSLPPTIPAPTPATTIAPLPPSKIENQKSKIKNPLPPDSTTGGLFDPPTSNAEFPLATAAPEHTLQTDSDLDPPITSERSSLRPVIGDYTLINTREQLERMIHTLRQQLADVVGEPSWLSVDTETDALGSMTSNLCGISLSRQRSHRLLHRRQRCRRCPG